VPTQPTDQPEFSAGGSQLQYAVARGAGSTPFPAPLAFQPIPNGIAANRGAPVHEQRAGTLPAAAVDQKTGRIYVAWEDGRFRSDGLDDLVFSSSADGVTWTKVKRINTGGLGNHVDHWNAMIEVGPDGSVNVGYRQRNETPSDPTARSATGLSKYVDTYFQRSTDQGKTWSSPLRVNKVRTDVGYAAYSRRGAFLGDYNQVAVGSNGWIYLVRNEALPKYKGEKCNCSFTSGNGHQHQYTYVAVIRP